MRPRSPCAFVNRFAGETAVFTEWRCTDEGQAHLLVSPAGKQVARIPGEIPHDAVSVRLEGDRWAFLSFRAISIYDVGSGKRLAELPIRDEAVATAHGVLHVFEMDRVELVSYDAAGKRVGSWRAPTCRFEWERETLGPLALEMPTQQVLKLLGQPEKKTKMTSAAWVSTWTYKDGAVVGIEADPDPNSDQPMLPFRVVYAAITAPSSLRTKAGIGVGSSRAELMAAYGAHVVASRSREGEIFISNDAPNDSDGMIVTLRDEKVTRIELGRAGWVDWPSDDDDLDAEDEE